VLLSYVQADTLCHIYFRFQAAIFNFLPTLTSSCTNIRSTMLFDAKHMWIPLKFHTYSIRNVIRLKCFRFHVHHFDCRLNSHRIVSRAMLLSAAGTSVSSNTNAATLNLLQKLIQWSPSLSHFHQKIIHTSFTSVGRRSGLRSAESLTLEVPRTRLSFGDRAFSAHAPRTVFPNVRSAQSMSSFRKLLKTFLFQRAYSFLT